jgi:hypothetical protein
VRFKFNYNHNYNSPFHVVVSAPLPLPAVTSTIESKPLYVITYYLVCIYLYILKPFFLPSSLSKAWSIETFPECRITERFWARSLNDEYVNIDWPARSLLCVVLSIFYLCVCCVLS